MNLAKRFYPAIAAMTAFALATNNAHADTPFSGFYAGVHGGYASVDSGGIYDSGQAPGEFFLDRLDLDDAAFGGQIGYLHQFGQFVVGIEGDASALTADDKVRGQFPLPGSYQVGAELNHLWSIRGRLGYAWGNLLAYGTAGYGEIDYDATVPADPNFPAPANKLSFDSNGAVYGGGIEYAFGKVLLRLEYLHYDVGNTESLKGLNIDFDAPDNLQIDDVDVVRGALSIKFF